MKLYRLTFFIIILLLNITFSLCSHAQVLSPIADGTFAKYQVCINDIFKGYYDCSSYSYRYPDYVHLAGGYSYKYLFNYYGKTYYSYYSITNYRTIVEFDIGDINFGIDDYAIFKISFFEISYYQSKLNSTATINLIDITDIQEDGTVTWDDFNCTGNILDKYLIANPTNTATYKANFDVSDAIYHDVNDMEQTDYSGFRISMPVNNNSIIQFSTPKLEITHTKAEAKCPVATLLKCDESTLNLFRIFRDTKLSRSRAGIELINWYYRHAEEVTALLNKNPLLKVQTFLFLTDLADAIRIEDRKTITLTADEYLKAVSIAQQLSKNASPPLRDIIQRSINKIKSPYFRTKIGININHLKE